VWDDPLVEKKTGAVTGKRYWTCGHCHCQYPTWNATKAKAHMARIRNNGIVACKARISDEAMEIYKLQWEGLVEKCKKPASLVESELANNVRMVKAVESIVSKGLSCAATRTGISFVDAFLRHEVLS
jgi:hypothetical protein